MVLAVANISNTTGQHSTSKQLQILTINFFSRFIPVLLLFPFVYFSFGVCSLYNFLRWMHKSNIII